MADRWTKTVRLEVGDDKQQWVVHPFYLTRDSSYFNSALKKHWKSGLKGVIRVEDVDPWLLHNIIEWWVIIRRV